MASLLGELGYPNAADQATVHWVISHPEIEVLVAGDAQDKAVGMISFSHRPQLRLNGRMARVEELVVAEHWRRRGVGRELMRHALERARSLSVKQVELVTHSGRDSFARPFYASCGFTEIDAVVLRMDLPPKGR
ncbi:MAG: GNAT family N-acetyltransferase [Myxococcaceae bacterium]